MIRQSFLIILLAGISTSFAQKETVPDWLDTIPPIVTTSPEKRYHTKPFYVSIKANEKATVYVGINSSVDMEKYSKSLSISGSGRTVIYFYAEDIYGNKSSLDTAVYFLDFQPPSLRIEPDPGIYQSTVILTLRSNEPCQFFRHSDPSGRDRVPVKDRLIVNKKFKGYISAVDLAGNLTRSNELTYIVDTTSVKVSVQPAPGIYNSLIKLSFRTSSKTKVYYSFDPNAPQKWFARYIKPVACPYGVTLVRYFARNEINRESAMMKGTYIIDTIPPRIIHTYKKGIDSDQLILSTKEKTIIHYSHEKHARPEEGLVYKKPIIIQHQGKAFVRAFAKDKAGNTSELFIWENKFDTIPPVIQASHPSGLYNNTVNLVFTASEQVTIFYTLDGSIPDETSPVYQNGILISKSGVTTVRYRGFDQADNMSNEGELRFNLDVTPPKVIAVIMKDAANEKKFNVALEADEPARIYYEIGEKSPNMTSPVYDDPISLEINQELHYFAIDEAGNRSREYSMNDLQKPMVTVHPDGGVYNKKIYVHLSTNIQAELYWRLLPDTVFSPFTDSIGLLKEGNYTVEYYSKSSSGAKSPFRRQQYLLDWTVPQVSISIRKGVNDSVSVFFKSNENASIYYTTDGTSPFYSATTQIAGNKFTRSNDRISIFRSSDARLAFFAEDAAGNQGAISVLDVFKPKAVPNIPSSTERVYNRILSLSFSTYDDKSQVYFERHNKQPTIESPVFTEPITLLRSDTIKTFVVDASGFKGEVESFVYLVDLPPLPQFSFHPEVADVNEAIKFSASGTVDQESPLKNLVYKWDFNGDGKVDKEKKGMPDVVHVYRKPGKYTVILDVVDPLKQSTRVEHDISVLGICPKNMVFVPRRGDKSFCIDKFEWPNKKDKTPDVHMSWIQAKMHCYDDGKHLCSAEEWQFACRGEKSTETNKKPGNRYPYGYQYTSDRCPTEGDKIYKSGRFKDCKEVFGTFDMIGNVWEWIADKRDGSPLIIGGSYKYGYKAQCGFTFRSSLKTVSEEIGFRCCK